jgi:hypothetical protein
MTRTLTLRVPDELYEWLIDRVDGFDGDLSATTRDAIDGGRLLYEVIHASDPHAKLQAVLDAAKEEQAREAYRDAFGEEPPR